MDASASSKTDAVNVLGFFLKIDGSSFAKPVQQKNTVIKYTKIPDFDFDTRVSWPTPRSYSLQPRLRRIIAVDDDLNLQSNRSLKTKYTPTSKRNDFSRKIATIPENEEYNLHPRFCSIKDRASSKVNNKSANRSPKTDSNIDKQQPNRIIARLATSTKFSIMEKSNQQVITTNRSAEANFKSQKQYYNRTQSYSVSSPTKCKEIKSNAKSNTTNYKKEVPQSNYKGNQMTSKLMDNAKSRQAKERVTLQNTKSAHSSRSSLSKNIVVPNETDQEIMQIEKILYENLKTDFSQKQKSIEKPLLNRTPVTHSRNRISFRNFVVKNTNPITVRVPLDNKQKKCKVSKVVSNSSIDSMEDPVLKMCADHSSYTDDIIMLKHVNIGTDPRESVDQVTEMDDGKIEDYKCDNSMQTDCFNDIFDSLEIPNVTLTKDKSEVKDESDMSRRSSLPNLKEPHFKISPLKDEVSSGDISICESTSYVYGHAKLTYTSRQKINFHVVGNEEKISSNIPPSPLDYPINVISVFKNELKKKQENVTSGDYANRRKDDTSQKHINNLSELNSLKGSYDFNKLMKPSDIISTIRVNNGLLENDYICEQFQRELNFIDSFFVSLQYLESCSLSEKCFGDGKIDSFVKKTVFYDSSFDIKNLEYDNFLSNLENGAIIKDSETMASKSLCLLNFLIRDEQRRAKNLLFVLKMREDALKDFTKSQILWLEKKKKHDNTDISTLKKKQRGALLKLQHECGEMQRMRKALLTLSEKRKIALMKTKKNIELKLSSNVDVEHIILEKKKLKRTLPGDRNASPLKCFDLSSSGCEESSTPRPNCDVVPVPTTATSLVTAASAEKCVQTADESGVNAPDTGITAENCVAVDGGYLNIIFNDLALPQIFSSGKQYEVNEKELKSIVSSTNTTANGTDLVEKLIEQIENSECETSSPSTARSLVDEFDQYYRGLADNEKVAFEPPETKTECLPSLNVTESTEQNILYATELPEDMSSGSSSGTMNSQDSILTNATNFLNSAEPCVCELVDNESNESLPDEEPGINARQMTGPLPVPVGAAAVVDNPISDVTTRYSLNTPASSVSDITIESTKSLSSESFVSTTPGLMEAEELRLQQLAIEKEIKALEQQQCRMLVVREIPDKPPPPYTPPTETKPRAPRMFAVEDVSKTKIETYLTESLGNMSINSQNSIFTVRSQEENKDNAFDSLITEFCQGLLESDKEENGDSTLFEQKKEEAFDIFVSEFCQESLERHKQEQSDKPWDACNLLPQKPQSDMQALILNTTAEIKDILSNAPSTVVTGVSGRRSDHIDDILFNEWRRCEPEWTTLHTDEAIVKNQLFDSIFQKILTETIDEYKKTVKPTD